MFLPLLVMVSCLCGAYAEGGCWIDLDASGVEHKPHLVDKNDTIVAPQLIDGKRIVQLAAGQTVTLACEGNGNVLMVTNHQINDATCLSGATLQVGCANFGYDELGCLKQVKETLRESGSCGAGDATVVEIGWLVGERFVNQITVCHDKAAQNTLYTIDGIDGAHIAADDKTNTRPGFRKGDYFPGVDADEAYSKRSQLATVQRIVGSETLAARYVDSSKSFYLARGHLSPDGDFIDAASQDASYYFINVLPQWQSFNNGNWKALELAVRELASSRGHRFRLYTGGFDVLKLADVNGVQQPIHLAVDENGNAIIPVPKFFWKVVHDTETNAATAFVALNNPHAAQISAAEQLCPDVCPQVAWVTWNRMDITKGYMYCCTAAALHRVVSYAPDLGDLALLV